MTDEPVYHFVRGTGWVPSVCQTVSGRAGNHMFIIEARPPEVGERYWTYIEPESALKILVGDYDALHDQWDGYPPGVIRIEAKYPPQSFWADHTVQFVTITMKRLND